MVWCLIKHRIRLHSVILSKVLGFYLIDITHMAILVQLIYFLQTVAD
jgi:hypothetical protein